MSDVRQFYNQNALEEWQRLERHRMERVITLKALDQFLPEKSRIIDIGGGPGRYAIALAQRGHKVALLDLSEGNIALAQQKVREAGVELERCQQADALDLSKYERDAYDAALLLGPLYHLPQAKDRDRAVGEAMARLKPGGLLFAAFITLMAPLIDILKNAPEEILERRQYFEQVKDDGINTPESGFTDAWFARPELIAPLMERNGLITLKLLAQEGFIASREPEVNRLSPEAFQSWAELCWRYAAEPSIIGMAEHLLYIGRKQ